MARKNRKSSRDKMDTASDLAGMDGGVDVAEYSFMKNPDFSVQGEIGLWRAVITQALMDAGNNSKKKEMRHARALAVAWLLSNGDDFFTVCSLAQMDAQYVRSKAREAIKRGCSWRTDLHKPSTPPRTIACQATVVYLLPIRAQLKNTTITSAKAS